jgi:hypothetical protein
VIDVRRRQGQRKASANEAKANKLQEDHKICLSGNATDNAISPHASGATIRSDASTLKNNSR